MADQKLKFTCCWMLPMWTLKHFPDKLSTESSEVLRDGKDGMALSLYHRHIATFHFL